MSGRWRWWRWWQLSQSHHHHHHQQHPYDIMGLIFYTRSPSTTTPSTIRIDTICNSGCCRNLASTIGSVLLCWRPIGGRTDGPSFTNWWKWKCDSDNKCASTIPDVVRPFKCNSCPMCSVVVVVLAWDRVWGCYHICYYYYTLDFGPAVGWIPISTTKQYQVHYH